MGPVLAMSRAMYLATFRAAIPRRVLAGLLALVALAGCSNDPSGVGPLNELRGVWQETFGARGQNSAARAGTAPIEGLTRAAIAGRTQPLLLVRVPSIGAAATLSLRGVNDGVASWRSGDGVSVQLAGPALFATRGLALDLLAAETAPLTAALAAGGSARYGRQYRYLDPQSRIVVVRYACTLRREGAETITVLERRHDTARFLETCADMAGGEIENRFWLGGDGTAWRTRQWIGPGRGYLLSERLIR